ncbi:phage portal protein [Nocardiopsis dassonvillei]|uniref:phage portal protein n=1 Tax=Nocardiopsis dassonvillei TaxID=2014 RepID=UPI00362F23FF
MGLLDRINARRRGNTELGWPVGAGSVFPGDETFGHDPSEFSPEKYGDYLATSNEVYSAVSLRARLVSSLKLNLYSGHDAQKTLVTKGPVVDLLRHVNPFWTWRRLMRMDEMCMGIWGQTFWAVEKGRDGTPEHIWWMKPSRVRPVPDEKDYLKGFLYEPIAGGPLIRFDPDEVIWFRYPNPLDEFSPMSPLAAARLAADTASSMMKANQSLFTNGLNLGGIIIPSNDKSTFTAEQAKELGQMLDTRFRGADKAHRWLVMRFEAQLKGLDLTPKDAEFLGGLNLTLRQVANSYGIPTPLLNDMEHATLANLRELDQTLWSHSLQPDCDLKADEIEEQLLPMFGAQRGFKSVDHVAWDYDAVPALQEAKGEVWDRDRQAIEAGALTVNEWRERNGLPRVAWGDVWWGAVNKHPVEGPESTPGAPAPTPEPAPDPDPDPPPDDLTAILDERLWDWPTTLRSQP